MHVLVTHVTDAALSTSPLLPIKLQKLPGFDIELHLAASAAGLQHRAASATIVHIVVSQEIVGELIKPLLPLFAQN